MSEIFIKLSKNSTMIFKERIRFSYKKVLNLSLENKTIYLNGKNKKMNINYNIKINIFNEHIMKKMNLNK